jgi:hypothetical protein
VDLLTSKEFPVLSRAAAFRRPFPVQNRHKLDSARGLGYTPEDPWKTSFFQGTKKVRPETKMGLVSKNEGRLMASPKWFGAGGEEGIRHPFSDFESDVGDAIKSRRGRVESPCVC